MTTDEIRPFDRQRRGIALGEGSAVLVLEPFTQARSRGAPIYARVLGHGLCNDAFHSASPDLKGGGMARSIRRALAMAGLAPSDIQYVNAHGTGTRHNDIMESAALHQVFGADAARIPVSSTKSMVGHTLGAAGAVELVASVLAMARGFIPPTINSLEPDPALDLDIVPNQAREARLERMLSCNAGFAGNNAAVVLGAA